MGRSPERRSLVPWQIDPSDLVEAGEPELTRSLLGGIRQIGMVVYTSCACHLPLGLLALRCEQKGGDTIPMGICLADHPIIPADSPMNMALLSGPVRHLEDDGHD